MALIKLNNKAVSNATAFGSITSLGSMRFIKKLTASSSATLSFVDGTDGVVLDDTYKEYVFTFNNIHPSSSSFFAFQGSTNTGSSYGVTATTTFFRAQQTEAGADATLAYDTSMDLAQSTSFIRLGRPILIDNDASLSGTLKIFNPSSTTFVKHYMYNNQLMGSFCQNAFGAGYFNDGSNAIDGIQFKMESGNIDAGDICLYGIA
jgi:hypothetical protein